MRYLKIIIWAAVIAYLCFSPGDGFKKVHINIPHFDKVVHFGMFFIAGLLLGKLKLVQLSKFHKLYLPVLFMIYAAATELIQWQFIEGRNGSVFDFTADLLGLWLGIMVFVFVPYKIQKMI